ncbi:MAG: hypothetical protein ACKPKO_11060, partial [Candidatus Fonsibacter sp.]
GIATVLSGCFADELEVRWLRECWSASVEELENSDMDGATDQILWKRLDEALSKALQGTIKTSGKSLSEDVALKAREFFFSGLRYFADLRYSCMMIDYCKSNRSLQGQYTWQDI